MACEYPELLKEWDYCRNDIISVNPEIVSAGSNRKVHWKCSECGYEWMARIADRTFKGRGCPVCAHQKVWGGHNDLETLYPDKIHGTIRHPVNMLHIRRQNVFTKAPSSKHDQQRRSLQGSLFRMILYLGKWA